MNIFAEINANEVVLIYRDIVYQYNLNEEYKLQSSGLQSFEKYIIQYSLNRITHN